MVSKAKRLPTTTDALINSRRIQQELYGLSRLRITTKSIAPPSKSGTVTSTSEGGGGTGAGLQTVGDSMIGPIAFFPVDADIVSDAIDISPTGNNPSDFSSYVRLLPEGGINDELLTINGTAFSGQLLYLQGKSNLIVDIIEGTAINGGNILSEGVDLVLVGDQIITLIFDPDADTGDPAVNGAWRVVAGGSATGRQLLFATLSADQTSNLTAGNHVEFDTEGIGLGQLVLSTGGGQADGIVSGFIAGRIYNIEYGIRMEGSGNAAALVVRPRINDTTDTGTTANAITVSSNENQSFIPTGFAIFIPNADTDTIRLEIIGSDSVTDIFADSTYMIITSDIEGGSSGGGGASTLDQLNDVTITTPLLNQVLTFNGSLWVNQAPAGGGLNQDLSNLSAPTIPGVDLNMNNNAILGVTGIDLDGASPIIQGIGVLDFVQAGVQIITDSGGLTNTVSGSQSHDFVIGGNSGMELSSVALTMKTGFRIADVPDMTFALSGENQVVNKFSLAFDPLKGGVINVPTGEPLVFEEFGTTRASFQKFLTIGYTLNDIVGLHLSDSTNSAVIDGEMRLDGNDVFIGTGGLQVNITTLANSLTTTDRIESPDTLTNIIATNGTLQMKIAGTTRWTMNSVNLTIDRSISLGQNNISDVGKINPFNSSSTLGDGSTFFGNTFTSFLTLGNTANSFFGDTGGIDYNTSFGRKHEFQLGGLPVMEINSSQMELLNGISLDMNGGAIVASGNITMFSSSRVLNMNGGDITNVDDLTFSGSGSRIDMNGGDILGVDDFTMNGDLNMQVSGRILNVGTIEMSGSIDMNSGDINEVGDLILTGVSSKIDLQGSSSRIDYTAFSTTATTGAGQALPANPVGYFTFQFLGTDVRVPFYNT